MVVKIFSVKSRTKRVISFVLAISMMISAVTLFKQEVKAAVRNVSYTVNTNLERKAISPYIFGINGVKSGSNQTATRSGGNRLTGYNWTNGYSNAGEDWRNFNDSSMRSNSSPASSIVDYVNSANSNGLYQIVTVPMAGYVANDGNDGGSSVGVTAAETAPSARFAKIVDKKPGGPESFTLTPADTSTTKYPSESAVVYSDEFINYLVNKFGKVGEKSTAIKGYSLDNEPALWSETHPRIHPEPVTIDELMEKSISLSGAIKSVDANTEVIGPALYGFAAYMDLGGAVDWSGTKTYTDPTTIIRTLKNANAGGGTDAWNIVYAGDSKTVTSSTKYKDQYDWFISLYLDKMKKASDQAGMRLLDVFDLHYYSEARDADNKRVTESAATDNAIKARVQSPRTLIEKGYNESSWITSFFQANLPIIPKVKESIDKYYPDTKLSFSEWSFGSENHVSGGIASADFFGICSNYSVYLATCWPSTGNTDYLQAAIKMFRNYDGKNSQYGNTSVKSTTSDLENGTVYASIQDENDGTLHIILINKNLTDSINATINVTADSVYTWGEAYGFDGSSSSISKKANVGNISRNVVSYTLSPLSVTHLILYSDDAQSGTVSGVSVSPQNVTVIKGEAMQFTASVTGTGNYDQSVTWSVSGGVEGTSISADGILTVALNETASALTVTAASAAEPDIKNTAIITIGELISNDPYVTSIYSKNVSWVSAGTNSASNPKTADIYVSNATTLLRSTDFTVASNYSVRNMNINAFNTSSSTGNITLGKTTVVYVTIRQGTTSTYYYYKLTIHKDDPVTIKGKVSSAEGIPIVGASVQFKINSGSVNATAGTSGSYSLSCIDTRSAGYFVISADGYLDYSSELITLAGFNINDMDFVLTADTARYSLTGLVLDKIDETPISGALVTLYVTNGVYESLAGSAETDSEGRYTFGNLPSGIYRIEATASGYSKGNWDSGTAIKNSSNVATMFLSNTAAAGLCKVIITPDISVDDAKANLPANYYDWGERPFYAVIFKGAGCELISRDHDGYQSKSESESYSSSYSADFVQLKNSEIGGASWGDRGYPISFYVDLTGLSKYQVIMYPISQWWSISDADDRLQYPILLDLSSAIATGANEVNLTLYYNLAADAYYFVDSSVYLSGPVVTGVFVDFKDNANHNPAPGESIDLFAIASFLNFSSVLGGQSAKLNSQFIWSVNSASSAVSNGVLTVGADEQNAYLTVTATSIYDVTKSASLKIPVKGNEQEEPVIEDYELPLLRMFTDEPYLVAGQSFSLSTVFDEPVKTNVMKVNYVYDENKYEYQEFIPANGVSVLSVSSGKDSITLYLMIDEYVASNLGDAVFKVLEDVDLVNGGDGNNPFDDPKTTNNIGLHGQAVVKVNDIKQIFNSWSTLMLTTFDGNFGTGEGGKVTLIDLSNLADEYGMTYLDLGWEAIRFYDFNKNGEIDIHDIAELAKMIEFIE